MLRKRKTTRCELSTLKSRSNRSGSGGTSKPRCGGVQGREVGRKRVFKSLRGARKATQATSLRGGGGVTLPWRGSCLGGFVLRVGPPFLISIQHLFSFQKTPKQLVKDSILFLFRSGKRITSMYILRAVWDLSPRYNPCFKPWISLALVHDGKTGPLVSSRFPWQGRRPNFGVHLSGAWVRVDV